MLPSLGGLEEKELNLETFSYINQNQSIDVQEFSHIRVNDYITHQSL